MINCRTYSKLYGNNKNLDKGSDVLTDIEEYEKMGWIVVGSLSFFYSKILADGASVPFDIQDPHLADNADDLIDSGVVRMMPDGNQCELTVVAISFINDFVDNTMGGKGKFNKPDLTMRDKINKRFDDDLLGLIDVIDGIRAANRKQEER